MTFRGDLTLFVAGASPAPLPSEFEEEAEPDVTLRSHSSGAAAVDVVDVGEAKQYPSPAKPGDAYSFTLVVSR